MTRIFSERPSAPAYVQGFSLLEMAIVLMILGVLLSGVLVSISQTTLNARRTATLAQLREVEEALYGFAESQGRLPCPATPTSKGFESGTPGVCTNPAGFVPAATLGLFGETNSEGLLVDSWGNPLRYSLATTPGAGNPDFSKATAADVTAIKNFFNAGSALDALTGNMLKICDDNTCSGTILTNVSPAAVFSMGENWSTSTSANEDINAGSSMLGIHRIHLSTELTYVSTQYSEENFDDQIVWLSPYILFNRMVSAGKLP